MEFDNGGSSRKIYKVIREITDVDRIQAANRGNPIPKDAKFKVQLPTGGGDKTTEMRYFKTRQNATKGIEYADARIEKMKTGFGSNVRTTVPKNATYLKDRKTYRIPTEEEYIFEEYNPKTKKSKFLMTGARKIEGKKYYSKSTHATLKEAIEAKENLLIAFLKNLGRLTLKFQVKQFQVLKIYIIEI